MLLSYGFTIQNNPDDTVMLKLKPSLDSVRQAIRDKQISAGDDAGIYHLGVSNPTPPMSLLQLFRVIVANQWELDSLRDSPKDAIIGRNEIAAKTQILRSLQMKLTAHTTPSQTIYPEDYRESHFENYANIFRKGQIEILKTAISKLEDELKQLYSQCIIASVDDLTKPYRRFSKAIEMCFGDAEDQAESGIDEIVFMLAICNVLLEHENGSIFLAQQVTELLQHYPIGVPGDEAEEARIRQLYDDVFPAVADVAPKVFQDNRWTLDLLRWGSQVYQGEIIRLFVDDEEQDVLVFKQ